MATKKPATEKKSKEDILEELEKRHGLKIPELAELKIVSTGSLQLNRAMHIGGTALGKMIEIWGQEASGKTTLMLHQMAEYQRTFRDRRVAYFDYENAFDPKYARSIGVDVQKLLIYQPVTQEQGYDMIIDLVKNDIVSCVVIDSQTSAVPKAVLEGTMEDAKMALQARNNSKFCPIIKGLLNLHQATLFFVSQTRDKIGSMGDTSQPTGGNAIKFYCDIRWKVWKMNDKENEANKTTVDVMKSKVEKPFGQAKFSILWGRGIDSLGEIIDYAIEFGIVKRAGSYYQWKTFSIAGMVKFREFLDDCPDELCEIHDLVIDRLKSIPVEETESIVEPSPQEA